MICSGWTLSAFFAQTYRPQHLNLTDQAAANIARDLRKFDEWAGSPIGLNELSDELVIAFMRHRQMAGDSAATINGRRAKILAVWRFARAHVTILPGSIPRIKEPRRIPRAWTITQVEALLAYARQLPGNVGRVPKRHFWPALVEATYWTGCRPTALLSTKSGDFSPGERYLIVRAASEKTNRDRYYSLHPQCVAAIAAIWDPCLDLLFPWPFCPRYLWTCFRRIVEGAGLPSGKDGRQLFYRLRRTNLSYCAAADERIAQAQGGHADFATTRRYLDPTIARSRSAADVLPVPRLPADTRQLTLPGF